VTADAGAAAAAAVVTVMGIQCRGVEPEVGAPAAQHPAPSTQPTTGGAGRGGLAVAWRLLLLLPQQGLWLCLALATGFYGCGACPCP
jgi:hypothetical protein